MCSAIEWNDGPVLLKCDCDAVQALVWVHVCGVIGGEMKEHKSTTVYNAFAMCTPLSGMMVQPNPTAS